MNRRSRSHGDSIPTRDALRRAPRALGATTRFASRAPLSLIAWVALISAVATGCRTLPERERMNASEPCSPQIGFAAGWLGGDAAYSVPFGDPARHEAIWLFGDTFIGRADAADRVGAAMIHNSVGRSRCSAENRFEIDYEWRHGEPRIDDGAPAARATPRAIFDTGREDRWYWPFDGFVHAGRLYVLLLEVEASPADGALALPFRLRGAALARVSNPNGPAFSWQIDTRRLTTGDLGFPTSAALVDDDHVQLMGFLNAPDNRTPRILARIPLAAIERWAPDLAGSLETWGQDGTWLSGFQPDRARVVMADNATEMSLDREAPGAPIMAVYSAPRQRAADGAPSEPAGSDDGDLFARTAPTITGPWSARVRLYDVPEQPERQPLDNRPVPFCYAGKAHAEQSSSTRLMVTYVCNLTAAGDGGALAALAELQRRMDLYRPVVVPLPWPEGARENAQP